MILYIDWSGGATPGGTERGRDARVEPSHWMRVLRNGNQFKLHQENTIFLLMERKMVFSAYVPASF
ncbi:hypothetical protein CD33_07860 [Ureibacillus sinduriensis BLB-1 = JCM 15800]|uniref:Uncharacterized protein n=1 Tax=Ureibacillus sinduriensis BLB-1 = JCM 15800 TaxID=1384057 RepID=A0A0A3HXX0_9BACL|nr:hypothetical protein CD33_07860 [Ureibacillus sinduriensis BLB-1 = JCM 15800]